jgi:hypothetical protein
MKTIAQELGVTDFPFEIRDGKGNLIYIEMEDGFWIKWQWSNKRQMYCQNSSNYWEKREYDSSGNEIYYENSTGKIINNRPQPEPTPNITIQHCLDRGFTIEKVHDEVYKEKHGRDYKICYLKLSKRHMIDYCVTSGNCEVYKLGNEGTILERKHLKDVNDLDFYIRFLSSEKVLSKLSKQKTIQEVINVMDDFILKQTKN